MVFAHALQESSQMETVWPTVTVASLPSMEDVLLAAPTALNAQDPLLPAHPASQDSKSMPALNAVPQ